MVSHYFYPLFLPRDTCISAAFAVVRCLFVTFVYCVETAKDKAVVAVNRKPYASFRMTLNDRDLRNGTGWNINRDLHTPHSTVSF